MDERVIIGLFFLVCLAVAAIIFAAIASKKNRNPWAWGILGFLGVFGFIGFVILLIVLACLPTLCPKCRKSLKGDEWNKRQCPRCGDIAEHASEPAHPAASKTTCDRCGGSFPSAFYLEKSEDGRYLCEKCRAGLVA